MAYRIQADKMKLCTDGTVLAERWITAGGSKLCHYYILDGCPKLVMQTWWQLAPERRHHARRFKNLTTGEILSAISVLESRRYVDYAQFIKAAKEYLNKRLEN